MVTRPSVEIQSCSPTPVLSEPSFHAGSHFTACSTLEKTNKDPGDSPDLCFTFSLEGWRYIYQLWSVEIPQRSHKRQQRNSCFFYSCPGFKGYNLPTIQILSQTFINQILQKQEFRPQRYSPEHTWKGRRAFQPVSSCQLLIVMELHPSSRSRDFQR